MADYRNISTIGSVSLLQCVTECIGIIVPQTRRQSIYVNNVGPWNAIKYICYHDTDRLFGLAVFLNPLNPSLKTTFSVHVPLTHHISISAEVLTPKLNPFPLPALMNRLMILTSSTHQQACNSQHICCHTACPCSQGRRWPTQSQQCLF